MGAVHCGSTRSLGIMHRAFEDPAIEEALNRGFWTVKVPSMAVFLGPIAVFLTLGKLGYIPTIGYPGMKWALPTFVVSLVGSWLVWSIQVPRWRLWSYRRVKSIALLKQMAVANQIIWNDGNAFERTEIMSRAVREELKRLEMAKA
jgi:hypothetical protein